MDDDDLDMLVDGVRKVTASQKKKKKKSEHVLIDEQVRYNSVQAVSDEVAFRPTYAASRHERGWILDFLGPFYTEQMITDVVARVKGGKEANVYCCQAHPSTGMELVAAKVYRPQMFRSLRNDARYRQGRDILNPDGKITHNRRELLAASKNTRFGQELRHVSWLDAEYETLQILHEAGADVPKPLAKGSNVILMEYVGERRAPAPSLNHVNLDRAEAHALFDRLVANLAIMLSCHRVHADFSAYNILYWEGECTIIDFPQAVDPRRNPDAADLFVRDVERLCQYFHRYHVDVDAHALADSLWGKYQFF